MVWNTGDKIGENSKYTIEKLLESGRFSSTFLAYYTDGENKERLVIKALKMFDGKNTSKTPAEIKDLNNKLHKEATRLGQCNHPHVVKLIDEEFIETDSHENELVCLPMEYISKVSLEDLDKRVLPEKEALRYIRQIGEALIAVHKKGLVHLDVKPNNILIRQKTDEAVLIGFDFSRAPSRGFSKETQKFVSDGFAALEWYRTDQELGKLGAWSDVYSLAAVLYWLLTGVVPPSADDRHRGNETLKSVTELNPEISGRVKNAIEKGMAIKRKNRPKTVKEWLNKLGGYRLSLDCFDSPKWGAVGAIAGIVAALATVAGLYIAWMSWKNSTPSPQVEPTSKQLKIKN